MTRGKSGTPGGTTSTADPDELLTTRQAAAIAGVGTTSIKRWSDEGRLPVRKTAGGHRRYRRADVERMLGEGSDGASLQARLPKMSAEEIDRLAVGVVQLDDAGYVLHYNRAESRFSGVAASDAKGQHFFGELAPCTNNRLVYGAFQNGMRDEVLDLHLDYTFTYRMRPTRVRLHLFRDKATATNWLVVEPQ